MTGDEAVAVLTAATAKPDRDQAVAWLAEGRELRTATQTWHDVFAALAVLPETGRTTEALRYAASRSAVSHLDSSADLLALDRAVMPNQYQAALDSLALHAVGNSLANLTAEVVLDEARRTLDSLTDTRDAVPPVQGLLRGSVSVGTEQCLGAVDVPALLARFRSAYPGVVITLRQAGSAELLDEIRQGRLDVGFVVASDPLPGGVDLVPLARQPMVLVCHPDHRLAAAQSVKLRALTDEVFVDFRTGWGSRRIADRAFLAAAVDRHVAMEVEDVHTLLHLVEHNLGVALVPNPIARKSKRLRTLAVDDPATPEWRACVATRSGSTVSRATEVLLSLVSS